MGFSSFATPIVTVFAATKVGTKAMLVVVLAFVLLEIIIGP